MKVKSESEVAQSYPTLGHPMDCSPPGSSNHGIIQARIPEWGAIIFFDKNIRNFGTRRSGFESSFYHLLHFGSWKYLLLESKFSDQLN